MCRRLMKARVGDSLCDQGDVLKTEFHATLLFAWRIASFSASGSVVVRALSTRSKTGCLSASFSGFVKKLLI